MIESTRSGCEGSTGKNSEGKSCKDYCPFNSDDSPPKMDDRSDAKGPEPECVTTKAKVPMAPDSPSSAWSARAASSPTTSPTRPSPCTRITSTFATG